jgi:AraC-like DNA-binding protein
MEVIRPLKLGALSLPDSESRLICRTILLDMLGEATITVEDGDLAGVTGLFWKHVDLSLATLHFPRLPLRFIAHGIDAPDIVMIRSIDGPLIVRHRQLTFEMEPRDVILLPADSSLEIILSAGGRFDCAHLPHSAIAAQLRKSVDSVLLKPFSSEYLPLQLLTNYAGYLLRQDHQDKQHASMMVSHFYDLLPVLVQHVNRHAGTDGPQSRLEAIKVMIEENLTESSFSIGDVAKAEGITPRAIQKLFRRTGTTFSRHMLERRLLLAKSRILADNAATPIGQIVYSVGFNDLSYFNRTFRSRYGISPTDLRRMSAQTAIS